ncbi:hypothetical protein HHK36_018116 [Tetracentron sinense]|uniref:Uncharacterized protein n=1 Tax=Tetracentron sinense TaxID=13715 RepID=A0A835DAI9_TETSI|nr:hypothetical protein HHK36_018116 [Tetracentron sinense]
MSTRLEFPDGLPEIRLQPIKIPSRHSLEDGVAIQLKNDDNECRTPTSDEHKIPLLRNCPPAPRKPKMVVLSKRKFSELQFFEFMIREEVESFFRSSFKLRRVR